jgi:hypothetical protein
MGAAPRTRISRDSSWAARIPVKRSRTTAMTTTATAAPESPCSVRVTASRPIEGAAAQSTDITPWAASPMSSGRRRPNASDNGPMISWPKPRPTSRPVMVSCAWESVAPISALSWGRAGR